VTAQNLLINLRARGLRLKHVGAALHVAPRTALTDADREALREHRMELVALLQTETDPEVTAVIDVFPGARVISTKFSVVWPPEGGWVPSSARAIDPYAATAPTVPCPGCGAMMWGLAGSGWCCRRCHPDPRAVQVDHATHGAALQEHPLFSAAEARGFPPASLTPLHPGATVVPTRDGWLRFVATAAPEEITAARAALARLSPASAPDTLNMSETTNSTKEKRYAEGSGSPGE
jgi:hypothetical protein